VKWSKHVSFENPVWQMAAMHHTCNISAFWERIAAPDKNIFAKFGGYVDNGLPKCVELSKYDSFENPIWQTVAIYLKYNIPGILEMPADVLCYEIVLVYIVKHDVTVTKYNHQKTKFIICADKVK